jgi:sensor histidine kinase YesM
MNWLTLFSLPAFRRKTEDDELRAQACSWMYGSDKKARLIGIPVVAFVMHFAFYNNPKAGFIEHIVGMGFALLTTFLYWEGIRQIWASSLNKFPSITDTAKRIIMFVALMLVYTFLVTLLIANLSLLLQGHDCTFRGMGPAYLTSLIPAVIVSLIYESVFLFQQWELNVRRSEALARENITGQLAALKNQLDPHFLFNSLNTLASLIDEENTPAQEYLMQLADVYRYVLVAREQDTVTLEEEMKFLNAYLYLNKARFRENLQFESRISAESLSKKVVPFSLQLLVENALKHNIISKDKPLKLLIKENDDKLTIANNRQHKNTLGSSTGLGLKNIMNRYRLLNAGEVVVQADDQHFSVSIPLIV